MKKSNGNFGLNLSDQDVRYSINLEGAMYNGSNTHMAVSFADMDEERVLSIDTDQLPLINEVL